MELVTRFDLGQVVYAVRHVSAPVWVPCGFCGASGRVTGANGESRSCPECYGRRGEQEWLPTAWRVAESLTLARVRLEVTASPGLLGEGTFDNFMALSGREELYMAVESGVGSGTLWQAEDLFASVDEAEAACEVRNAPETTCEPVES